MKPIAVLGADLHMSLPTKERAELALEAMVKEANELGVPLILAGDAHDSKANIRAECIRSLRKTLRKCEVKPYVIVGNHDLVNEKGSEHALHFIEDIVHIVDKPLNLADRILVPYFNNREKAREFFKELQGTNKIVIMHQGVVGSNMGDYIQDATAIDKEDLDGIRAVSGHYHRRQTIKCGKTGLLDYIGNSYTLGFGEAEDPEKGFQILYSDGALEFVPTNLYRHTILRVDAKNHNGFLSAPSHGYYKIVITGTRQDISNMKTKYTGAHVEYNVLDEVQSEESNNNLTKTELLDNIIDNMQNTEKERKSTLKELWRKLAGN